MKNIFNHTLGFLITFDLIARKNMVPGKLSLTALIRVVGLTRKNYVANCLINLATV